MGSSNRKRLTDPRIRQPFLFVLKLALDSDTVSGLILPTVAQESSTNKEKFRE